jgi:hypothetical protein
LKYSYEEKYYNSERIRPVKSLNIETHSPTTHYGKKNLILEMFTNFDTAPKTLKRLPSSYKSVRFEKESKSALSNTLDYSLTEDSTIFTNKSRTRKHENSKLSASELNSSRQNLYPYTKKTKKIKRMQKASLSRSRDPNLPHEYYPKIKSPLRNNSLSKMKSGKKAKLSKKKSSKKRRSRINVFLKKRIGSKSPRHSCSLSRSRSKSTKRKLFHLDKNESEEETHR